MYTDFLRQRTELPQVGPDIAPMPMMAPPNPSGGMAAPGLLPMSQGGGLSPGSVSALSGFGTALGTKLAQRHQPNPRKIYDSPMPAKRPPFQTLGPPMEVV